MISRIATVMAWFVSAILLFFTARRWLFMVSALLPGRTRPDRIGPAPDPFDVLLLASVRNEAESLPKFLAALAGLDYPASCLTVVLIDDASTDDSRSLMERWVSGRRNWHLLPLERNRGKAGALNIALSRFPQSQLIAVYDADERPCPTTLRQLVSFFVDESVGGVSGRRAVSNPLSSPAASYTTFEGLVHQLVTMRAKDKLKLAPAILGANCVYRREALVAVGNFKPGALLEDSDLTLKLARAGWQVRFEPEAISYHRVTETISGYWQQHIRWARGFNEVAQEQTPVVLGERCLPLGLRLELLAFSLGYLDRLAVLAGVGLLLFKRTRWLLIGALSLNLLTPLCQIIAALSLGREPRAMWVRVIWVPFFFVLDIAMAATGFWHTWQRSPMIWEERRARDKQ